MLVSWFWPKDHNLLSPLLTQYHFDYDDGEDDERKGMVEFSWIHMYLGYI